MPTYYSLQAATNNRQPATDHRPGPTYAYGEFDIAVQGSATAFVLNDIVRMIKVPKGARILDVMLYVPSLDTGTAVVVAVGDQDGTPDDDRYISGSTIGRSSTAGMARLSAATGVGYKFAADGYLEVKVTTAATTAAVAGVVKLWATYTLDF